MRPCCVLLSACSPFEVYVPAPPFKPPELPSQAALREGVKKGVEEEKLSGGIEISALRKTDRGPGSYYVCLREANPQTERHFTYS